MYYQSFVDFAGKTYLPAMRRNNALHQSFVDFAGKTYLLRLFVNQTADPAMVATLYRTSKIKKYWRTA